MRKCVDCHYLEDGHCINENNKRFLQIPVDRNFHCDFFVYHPEDYTYIEIYQNEVKRTINTKLHLRDQLNNFCLGLSGEVGEILDHFKKSFYQGHELDKDKLKNEIGDVMWYLANMCNELGFDLEEVMIENIEKLNKRYPNGFTEKDSINREE